jgi:3'(2'), 5'-bisphosphate nucleotidase
MPEPSNSLERELGVATALARTAGQVALSMRATVKSWMKPGDEPVSQADEECSRLIVAGLRSAFPDDAILSEEAADDGSRMRQPRAWMIDPIDGTRDYLAGREGFAAMIGLCAGGRPILGVVYQPTADAMYAGVVATGSARLEREGQVHTLRVSTTDDLGAIRLVASRSHRTSVIDDVRRVLGISDELNIGSVGLKVGLISAGERDLYVNPSSRTKLWDTCAPEAILLAAGGKLSDLDGGLLAYDSPELAHRRGIVASNGLLHDRVIERMAPLFPRKG